MSRESTFNFSAGPCTLPDDILVKAQAELLDFEGTGMSIMEMSHRSKAFISVYDKCIAGIKSLLDVPDTHDIIFVQGGGTLAFAMFPLNLVPAGKKVGYVITGTWSKKAYDEAKIILGDRAVIIADTKASNYTTLPHNLPEKLAALNPEEFAYTYYCDNETIHGVEFPQGSPIVDALVNFGPAVITDVSSNFCSRPIDVAKFGIVFGGIQKNLGPSGAVILIVRKDLTARTPAAAVPTYLNIKVHVDSESMYNTPPCWNIYMVGLMAEYLKTKGLPLVQQEAQEKAAVLYNCIEESKGFFVCPLSADCRSNMNIPFRIRGETVEEQEKLEKEFLNICTKANLHTLAGHRSVGGLRASLYNGMRKAGVEKLVELMKEFQKAKQA